MSADVPSPDDQIFELEADVVLTSRARIARNL